MHTKLTLRLDADLIKRAKAYAADAGKSVSQIVADYFRLLTPGESGESDATPVVSSLRGVLGSEELSEQEYREHLEAKHR